MELAQTNNTVQTNRPVHFIRHFLNLKQAISSHTAGAYERDIKDFFDVSEVEDISLKDVLSVGMSEAEHWLLELIGRGLKPATISRKISSLSSLYRWMLKYQDNQTGKTLLYYNPFANLKDGKPPIGETETPFLTKEECQVLLGSFDTGTLLGLRNKTILSLALTTALRKSEIIGLRLGDIKKSGPYDVANVIRKGGRGDQVKIQPPVLALIQEYVEKTGRDFLKDAPTHLFLGHSPNKKNGGKLDPSTLNYMIKAACKRAGIEKGIKVHSTRHTAITLAILGGATIEKVRDFAAHKSIATTNRYIHSIDRLKDNAGDAIGLSL
ncbi:MAG: tyrosine-type recombinase/integrase [Turicibacter sp.]|nr:tyrosine-type recombinase/integrase [Turicibacter sp.]